MVNALGEQWKSAFLAFNFKPIASASIGQVHQAYSDAGDNLAVKVQYPGIRKSIDSDVDNVGTLLKIVGFIPESVDYKGLLEEAKNSCTTKPIMSEKLSLPIDIKGSTRPSAFCGAKNLPGNFIPIRSGYGVHSRDAHRENCKLRPRNSRLCNAQFVGTAV